MRIKNSLRVFFIASHFDVSDEVRLSSISCLFFMIFSFLVLYLLTGCFSGIQQNNIRPASSTAENSKKQQNDIPIFISPDAYTNFMIGQIWLEKNNKQMAQWYFRRALSSDEDSPYLNVTIAKTYINEEQYDEATDYCEDALELDPNFSPAIVVRGDIYLKQNEVNKAAEQYQIAIQKDPDNCEAYEKLFSLNVNNQQLNNFQKINLNNIKCEAPLKKLIETYINKGNILKSEEVLLIAVENFPDNIEWLYKLGKIKFDQGNLTEAIDLFNKLMRGNYYLEANYYLTKLWIKIGDTQKAVNYIDDIFEDVEYGHCKVIKKEEVIKLYFEAGRIDKAKELFNRWQNDIDDKNIINFKLLFDIDECKVDPFINNDKLKLIEIFPQTASKIAYTLWEYGIIKNNNLFKEKALTFLERYISETKSFQVTADLIKINLWNGNTVNAESIIEKNYKNTWDAAFMGIQYYLDKNNNKKVVSILNYWENNLKSFEQKGQWNYLYGDYLFNKGEIEKAEEKYSNSLKIYGFLPESWIGLARIAGKHGNINDVSYYCSKGLNYLYDSSRSFFYCSQAYRNLKELNKAENFLKKAFDLNPYIILKHKMGEKNGE